MGGRCRKAMPARIIAHLEETPGRLRGLTVGQHVGRLAQKFPRK